MSFHETKRERKFYEDKKQKALRYIDHTFQALDRIEESNQAWDFVDSVLPQKLTVIRKMVNDI